MDGTTASAPLAMANRVPVKLSPPASTWKPPPARPATAAFSRITVILWDFMADSTPVTSCLTTCPFRLRTAAWSRTTFSAVTPKAALSAAWR